MGLLILLRHAKAVRDHEAESDQARGLTARGRRDAAAAGAAMAAADLAPATMLVSPAARTRATADIVAPILATPPTLALRASLYMAGPEELWAAACEDLARGVMIVGHNPGLQMLATSLIELAADRSALARRLIEALPTAAWAAFEVEPGPFAATGARLIAAWSPKD